MPSPAEAAVLLPGLPLLPALLPGLSVDTVILLRQKSFFLQELFQKAQATEGRSVMFSDEGRRWPPLRQGTRERVHPRDCHSPFLLASTWH